MDPAAVRSARILEDLVSGMLCAADSGALDFFTGETEHPPIDRPSKIITVIQTEMAVFFIFHLHESCTNRVHSNSYMTIQLSLIVDFQTSALII